MAVCTEASVEGAYVEWQPAGRKRGQNWETRGAGHSKRVDEGVRKVLGQEKSHRNRVRHLDIVEPEHSNFTFQSLLLPEVD